MALFKLPPAKEKVNLSPKSGATTTQGINQSFIGKTNQKISEIIGEITDGGSSHYASLGDWSTHDLLFYLLNITGAANVYFSTWAISEFAIRQLFSLIESGLILELKGIFDYRNGIHKTAELEFLRNITTEIKAAKCHAKVCVIENDTWGIAIVGSANFTRNPRIEAGVICADKKIAAFHKGWIINELNNTSDFDKDNRRIAE